MSHRVGPQLESPGVGHKPGRMLSGPQQTVADWQQLVPFSVHNPVVDTDFLLETGDCYCLALSPGEMVC